MAKAGWYTCVECGASFYKKVSAGREPKYCGYECRKIFNGKRRACNRGYEYKPDVIGVRQCERCGIGFTAQTSAARHCPVCRRELNRSRSRKEAKRKASAVTDRKCACCDKPLTEVQRKYCSRKCSGEGNAERFSLLYRKEPALLRDPYGAVRKTRLRKAKRKPVERTKIFERDGWVCGICGKSVSKTLCWPHPMSVSLDHIVPLSKDGTHEPDNVQCAHLLCNSKKGNGGTV